MSPLSIQYLPVRSPLYSCTQIKNMEAVIKACPELSHHIKPMLAFSAQSRTDAEHADKIHAHTIQMQGESIMVDLYGHKRRIAAHEAAIAAESADEAAVEQQVFQIRTLFAAYQRLDVELRAASPFEALNLNAARNSVGKIKISGVIVK